MTYKIAINGFGRIGRGILRALLENPRDNIEIVAINDPTPGETLVHLLKYDSVHGRMPQKIQYCNNQNDLCIDDLRIPLQNTANPTELKWGGVDLVLECSGHMTHAKDAKKHLDAGAKRVLISAPGTDVDRTVVYGVNHKDIQPSDLIISNASCTTNCLAPLAKVIDDAVGIERGLMTTIHAYTADQRLQDGPHKDPHRARAAALNMIPTSTGAAKAVGLVLPNLAGKLDGYAMRVPTANVSIVDLTFTPKNVTSTSELHTALSVAANGPLKGVLDVNEEPLVSCDFNHTTASSTVDFTQTRVMESGKLIKILSWYDNEWGFANRMLDVTSYLASCS